MKRHHKVFVYILIIITVLVIGIRSYIYPDIPVYSGTVSLKGLRDSVNIYTDEFGVPHVFAKTDEDLFFSAGYIAARERLFQMSMVALAVRGELASALGEEYISSDIYLRTWRIHTMAKQLADNMQPEERKILNAFCDGINTHIEEALEDLPVELKVLGITPPLWRPSDVTGYARMMAHEMQSSWKSEIVYGAIADYFGNEKLSEIYPWGLPGKPTIADGVKPYFDEILHQEIKLRNLLGISFDHFGSNSWVLSGEKTKTGKPLLANDPHLGFSQPARWYEMHLKGGKYNTSGVCIAGIPVPVIGNNESCAWGFTNSMVDDVDFFIETINPKDPNQYLHGEKWKNMKLVHETIPLKNGKDTTVVVRLTHHGPVVSDIHPLLKSHKTAVSMSWVGHRVTHEMSAFMKLNTMKSWEDFTDAVRNFGTPGQNIIYADTAGNIGWRPAVYIPIRKEGNSLIPRPGHDPNFDWRGIVPFEKMPFLYNPDRGYIATANNKTIGDEFPYYISGLWADPSRAERINDLIHPMKNATIQDMKTVQLDLVSLFAKDIIPYLTTSKITFKDKEINKAIVTLKNWDGKQEESSPEALLFHSIVRALIKNIYGDELTLLGENYFEAFLGIKYLYTRNLRTLLKNGRSSWFDDISTKNESETMNIIIKRSITEGVNEVFDKYGKVKNNWAWGKAHSLTHPHLLGNIYILNKVFGFNVGPFLSGGSDKTVRAGGFSYANPYKQTAGASMRRIVDFDDLNVTQFILPTGQSGHPHSPHYKDQSQLYNRGKYKTTHFSESQIKKSDKYRKLLLLPK